MNEQIYTVQEIAQKLKVSDQLVYDLIKEKRLQAIKVGRQWRIRGSDLERFLVSQ